MNDDWIAELADRWLRRAKYVDSKKDPRRSGIADQLRTCSQELREEMKTHCYRETESGV